MCPRYWPSSSFSLRFLSLHQQSNYLYPPCCAIGSGGWDTGSGVHCHIFSAVFPVCAPAELSARAPAHRPECQLPGYPLSLLQKGSQCVAALSDNDRLHEGLVVLQDSGRHCFLTVASTCLALLLPHLTYSCIFTSLFSSSERHVHFTFVPTLHDSNIKWLLRSKCFSPLWKVTGLSTTNYF